MVGEVFAEYVRTGRLRRHWAAAQLDGEALEVAVGGVMAKMAAGGTDAAAAAAAAAGAGATLRTTNGATGHSLERTGPGGGPGSEPR